ncbi:MAG: DNA-3-methyladenine glycosylase [bacterium]|nr:DNA-3-methyladenine glycosylase [bacterium]
MRRKLLGSAFFKRRGAALARSLIGKYLVRRSYSLIRTHKRIRNRYKETALMINEVELYEGAEDRSSHAFNGDKGRAAVMFGPGGRWYVYLCYGMYEMLNLVVGAAGFPAAILIRGAGPYHGPGKLTRALTIDRTFNNTTADKKTGLWIEDRGVRVAVKEIEAGPRIGLGKDAGEWAKTPHRFVLKNR